MEHTRDHIRVLLRKQLDDSLTDAERESLGQWADAHPDNREVLERIYTQEHFMADLEAFGSLDDRTAQITAYVRDRRPVKGRSFSIGRLLPYAATILLTLASAWLFFGNHLTDREPEIGQIQDIAPGGNRATLTLADGRTISLSEAQTGIVVGEGISYTDGSLVLGEQANRGTSEQVHTLTTPKGGTYQIILPDRAKVWLNANSTLKYPSRFPENERIVELEGEAYFDVSEQVNERSQKTPFRVVSKGQTVEVLGTQFNISAYADDPEIKTTLVEGKVKVALAGSTTDRSPITDHRPPITLSPGEQSTVRARLPGQGAVIGVQQVDVNQYTAWKDGLIILNNADIATVVRQLERWYDVTFEVASWPEGLRLEGELPRNTKLSGIIDALQLNTGKQLYINGRRVMERQ